MQLTAVVTLNGRHAPHATICENFAVNFNVKFNSNKSVFFMRIGERYDSTCEPFRLFDNVLQQVQLMKYLGVCLVSAKKLKCDES